MFLTISQRKIDPQQKLRISYHITGSGLQDIFDGQFQMMSHAQHPKHSAQTSFNQAFEKVFSRSAVWLNNGEVFHSCVNLLIAFILSTPHDKDKLLLMFAVSIGLSRSKDKNLALASFFFSSCLLDSAVK